MEIFFIVHLLLMPIGFFLLAGGVITVWYLRKRMWWFRLHKMLGVLATVFFVTGGFAAVLMVYLAGKNHFSVPHTWLGAATIVLMAATLTAGLLQTRVGNKKRMRLIHRIAGRTVAGLSLITVVTGAMAAGISLFLNRFHPRRSNSMKILIVFYSAYGHIYQMAEAVAQGAREVPGAEVSLWRVPETLPEDLLRKIGAFDAQQTFAQVPVCTLEELATADAIIFGSPTRFGNMCGQMRQFLDSTGGLWAKGALVGKVGSVFTSSGTQHGGQESTILSFHTTLLHHGMIIVGLPYTFGEQTQTESVAGCSPYGASTIAGSTGGRTPNEPELAGARFQGRHVATITARLVG